MHNACVTLPKALTLKGNADPGVSVYKGVKDGKDVYAGITNNIARRSAQHGDRFEVERLQNMPSVTRGQARAIEEALIKRAGGVKSEGGSYENIRHSISPNHDYYQQAVDWGEQWLQGMGL